MDNFFSELKRRHIYRVAAAYAVVAWVLLQLFNNLEPILKLPEWAGTLVLVLLVGGCPVALLLAWIRELPPADGATSRTTATRLDYVLAGGLAFVLAGLSYQQLTLTRTTQPLPPSQAATTVANKQAGVEAARAAASSPASAISIAVLPFENLSADPEQAFFSAGMTEEITSALAKIPDLRVVARTSAFQLKDQNGDVQAIAQSLHATHIIKGSVRKAGTRLRITAQLINAESSLSLWTDTYDRELADVFVIQEDIARAIAASLRMPLGLKPGENIVNNRTRSEAAYEDYLRARALIRARAAGVNQAVMLLEQTVDKAPDFAPAWGLLSSAYRFVPRFDPVRLSGDVEKARPTSEVFLAKAEAAAKRAIMLDPNGVDAYWGLGSVEIARFHSIAAAEPYKRALALDSDNPDVLNGYSNMLAELGYLKQALPIREKLRGLEPYVPAFVANYALILTASGQTDAAIALYDTLPPGGGSARAYYYTLQGRYNEAADVLLRGNTRNDPQLLKARDAAVQLLRTAPIATTSPQALPNLGGALWWVYAFVGASERVLDYHEGNLKLGDHGGVETILLWAPPFASVRKTERFKNFAREAGFVDYWKVYGWPDLCRPMGVNDFFCD